MNERTRANLYRHAIAILDHAEFLNWPVSQILQLGDHESKYRVVTAKLLSCLIVESQNFDGSTVLEQFCLQLGKCHPILEKNVEKLKLSEFVSAEQSFGMLFQDLTQQQQVKVNFESVLLMGLEFLTQVGVLFMSTEESKSMSGTPFAVSDEQTVELVKLFKKDAPSGNRRQQVLKELSLRRDGTTCPLTGLTFRNLCIPGVRSALARVIPHPIHAEPDALKCIAMFAGEAVRDKVLLYLNEIGNSMNLSLDACASYDELEWGIEAKEEGGEVKYIYRTFPPSDEPGPGLIRLKDGDEIPFGQGQEVQQLGKGPIPELCNLRLAVGRVLKMSNSALRIS